jgi:AraC-like DNA-binding protein
MDHVLDMLRSMRLTGGMFLDAEFSAPWCVTAQVGPEDCAPFTPTPLQIIAYHYVTVGRLLLKVEGQSPISVERGEIVVLPRNDPHVIGSSLTARPVGAGHLIRPSPEGGLARISYGGGGERTQMLCGFLGTDMPQNPVFTLLPSVLKLNVEDGAAGAWMESSFRFAAHELALGAAKSPGILAKLAELLFMEAVRRFVATAPPDSSAWTAGIRDPVVGRALGLLHSQFRHPWTAENLAREVGLSRSAFAYRFNRLLGHPPMRYLARQRLMQAAVLLRETTDPVARIAHEVGYESEAAFNRAFKREHGAPPAEWRRAEAGRALAGPAVSKRRAT